MPRTWLGKSTLAACQALGIALVRRPTGGRAVLHEQDVTYSVVLPIGLGGTTLAADYCRIGTALATALQGLGLPVSLARRHGAPPRTAAAACFAALSRYEIGVAGKKLVGSAQKRLQRTLLQHGSIPLWLDRERLLRCLRVADPRRAAAEAAATMTAVNELAPAPVAPAALHAALRQGFAATFGVDFTPASPTPQEWALAHYLRQTKYATAAWNLEGPVAWRRLASAAGVDATTSNRVLTVATPAGNV
ncbi:MAG: octanoyltransferase LipM [Candidatus Tectimicrobiota bacterium]|nr:MAG: octanoyltransferase LipM [Candidatus Tectomicrobia bacterium]